MSAERIPEELSNNQDSQSTPVTFVSDQGSVTILVLSLCIGLLALLCALGVVVQLFIQQRHVEGAADLSALAGAAQLMSHPGRACETAQDVAVLNATTMSRCEVTDTTVMVTVEVPVVNPRISSFIPQVVATARAGY